MTHFFFSDQELSTLKKIKVQVSIKHLTTPCLENNAIKKKQDKKDEKKDMRLFLCILILNVYAF